MCRLLLYQKKSPTISHLFTASENSLSPLPLTFAPPDSPKLEISPEEAIVKEGNSVTMTCQILSSNPEYSTISWLKDGIPLREKETLQREQKMLTLTLSSVTKNMSGEYHCEAHNDIGSEKLQVTLQVLCELSGSWGGAGRVLAWMKARPLRGRQRSLLTPTPLGFYTFFQMLRDFPGFRSNPHQLRREVE